MGWFKFIVFLLVVAVLGLATYQNLEVTTTLHFDVFFKAFTFDKPIPVFYLLDGTLFAGFLLGWIKGLLGGFSSKAADTVDSTWEP